MLPRLHSQHILVNVLVLRQLIVTPMCKASLVPLLGIRRIARRGAGTRSAEVGTKRQVAGVLVSFPSTRPAQMDGEAGTGGGTNAQQEGKKDETW